MKSKRKIATGPEATRQALHCAATELFAQRGFKGATAELIARKAGVNKSMINYHFRGKKGLYHAVLRGPVEELVAEIERTGLARLEPEEGLGRFVELFTGVVEHHPRFPGLMLHELLAGGSVAIPEVLGCLRTVVGTVAGLIRKGIRLGRFRPVDPYLTHIGLMGGLLHFFITAPLRGAVLAGFQDAPRDPTASKYAAHVQEMLLRGLAAQSPGRRK
ncbi:MAG: TetR family transcriptional regulator [Candidatus Wallbacteria bacterium]|nr:TetR family transcriptional regulator [Candidatus Wallbacteria bacterium]